MVEEAGKAMAAMMDGPEFDRLVKTTIAMAVEEAKEGLRTIGKPASDSPALSA